MWIIVVQVEDVFREFRPQTLPAVKVSKKREKKVESLNVSLFQERMHTLNKALVLVVSIFIEHSSQKGSLCL